MEESIVNKLNEVLAYNEDKLYKVELEGYGDMSLKKDKFDGKHVKNFFRLNSLNLLPFLEKISNINHNYITYFNNILPEGNIPNHISVLMKKLNKKQIISEVIGAKITEYFGLNTPINFAMFTGKDDSRKDFVISVDFVSENEMFDSLDDYQLEYEKGIDIKGFFEDYRIMMQDNSDFDFVSEDRVKELENEIMLSFLVRDVLLGDSDFCSLNLGFLLNETDKKIKLINFDYEDAFVIKNLTSKHYEIIDYAIKNHPNVYQNFINKVNTILNSKKQINVEYKNDIHKKIVEAFIHRLTIISNHEKSLNITQLSIMGD